MTTRNPWLGLASYDVPKGKEEDYLFCGRDEETMEIVRLIDNNLFITLYGSSGIGKTSLLKAGVIPILKRKDYFPLYVRLSQESNEISYAEAIVRHLKNCGLTEESQVALEHADGNDRLFLWNYFATTRFFNAEGRETYPVIILDQFEEVFRDADKSKAELLLQQIYLLLNDELEMPDAEGYSADTNYRFVASIREDFLFVLEDSIDELSLDLYKSNRYRLRPMKPENARQVVLVPGRDCIEESEKEKVAERVLELAKKPQSDDIDTLLLSLVCAGTFDKKAGEKITFGDLSIWKDNPMQIYYQDAMRVLNANQIRYVQQHLIREDGSRKRVSVEELKKALGENDFQQLTKGKNRLFSIGDKGQAELLHDKLAMAVYEERKAFEEHERKKKLRRRVSVIGVLVLAIAGIFFFQNAKLKQQRWKMLENQARFISEKAESLVKEDSYMAKLLAINVLPNDLKHPNRPYIPEAERVLRDASLSNIMALKDYSLSSIGISDYQFTADGKRILSSSREGIRIWDMEKGYCIRFIPCQIYGGSRIINPDQGIVALKEGSIVKLIDIETGAEIKEMKTSASYIDEIIRCQDGSKIAVIGSEGLIHVFDVESGVEKSVFQGGYDNTFSPDGKLMIAINCIIKQIGKDDAEDFYNSKYFDGVLRRDSLKNLTTRIGDSEIRLIDVETGFIVRKVKTNTNLKKIVCSPDGSSIAALDYDGLIHIINLDTGNEENAYQGGYYYGFSPDSKSLAYMDPKEGIMKICDVHNGSIIHTIEMKFLNYSYGKYSVDDVRFGPNGKQVIVLSSNLIYVIDIKEPYTFAIDGKNSGETFHNGFSCDGKYFVSAKGKDVMIWDMKTKQCMRVLKGHKEDVYSVAISPNGEYVVSTDNTNLHLWNVQTGECMREFDIPSLCAIFSPDSKRIVLISKEIDEYYGSMNYIDIIDVETGELRRIDTGLSMPQHASFSPDGKRLALTTALPFFNVINTENDSVTPFGNENNEWYRTVEFSHDGKYIVSTSNKSIQIWNVEERKRIHVLKGHTSSVNFADFSPDDKFIVSSYSDNTIRVWDINSENCIHVIHLEKSGWGSIFSPDGRQIVAQVSDSIVFIDFPPLQELIDQTRERFKDRPLTAEERRMYYLE